MNCIMLLEICRMWFTYYFAIVSVSLKYKSKYLNARGCYAKPLDVCLILRQWNKSIIKTAANKSGRNVDFICSWNTSR